MYQYGNVAVKYQKENQKRPNIYKQPQKRNPQMNKNRPQPEQQAGAPKKIAAGEKILYLLGIMVAVTVLCMLLMNHASLAQINYEVQFLERELVTIQDRNDELRTEVAELSSPDRILSIARDGGLHENESLVKVLSSPALKTASSTEQAASSSAENSALQEHKRASRGDRE